MRRKDREVTDLTEIIGIIDKCEIIRLGLSDNGMPYIVPLNFGYKVNNEQINFFFHSANAGTANTGTANTGRKIEIMKVNPFICFELDCSFKITTDVIPCKWSAEYESVIGYGDVSFITDNNERKAAMDMVMKRYGYGGDLEYNPDIFSKTAIYQLSVSQMTAKRNIK